MNTFANGLYLFSFRWQNCSLFDGNLQKRELRCEQCFHVPDNREMQTQ